MSRNEGAVGEYDGAYTLYNFRTDIPRIKILEDLREKFACSVPNKKMTLEQKREIVSGLLWNLVFSYGIVYFGSNETSLGIEVAHLNSLMALQLNEEKYFLIVDPELKNNKFLTIDETIGMIQDKTFHFSLYDF